MSILIGGLAIGAVYSLVAIGLVLIFRATGVVNFAQGEIIMVGAYAYVLMSEQTASPILQLGAAVAAGMTFGLLVFVVTNYLVRKATPIHLVISTLAILIFAQATARKLYTDNLLAAPAWIFGDENIHLFGAVVAANSISIFGLTVVLGVALYVWERHTLFGKSVLAAAEDPWRASLTGISVRASLLVSWAAGGALGGIAGLLVVPITGVFPSMGMDILIPAFVAAILGGFSSPLGALLGGLIVGMTQTYAVVYLGGAYKEAVLFAMLLLVLLWRPSGLFGAAQVRQV